MNVHSISPTAEGGDQSEMVSAGEGGRRRDKGRTEHLKRLPDWLLVEDMMARVGVVAVLDALHVLCQAVSAAGDGLCRHTHLPLAPERVAGALGRVSGDTEGRGGRRTVMSMPAMSTGT